MSEQNEGVVVQLDVPRRLRLTLESMAKIEEEKGVEFRKFTEYRGQDEEGCLSRILWAFSQTENPGMTELEAKQIIRRSIMNTTRGLKIKRMLDLRAGVFKALKAFKRDTEERIKNVEEDNHA